MPVGGYGSGAVKFKESQTQGTFSDKKKINLIVVRFISASQHSFGFLSA